jgi:hypothetical protein
MMGGVGESCCGPNTATCVAQHHEKDTPAACDVCSGRVSSNHLGRDDLPYVAACTNCTRARSGGLHKLCEPKAKLTTKIGFWQNEPNLRDPIAELGE